MSAPGPPEPLPRAAALALLVAVELVLFAAAAEAVAAAGLAAGVPVSAAAFLPAAALALGAAAAGARALAGAEWPRTLAAAAAAGAAAVASSLLLAGLAHDHSFDGQWYHQPAVVALARGWNPWTSSLGPEDTTGFLYANHFARGPWLLGAALYRLTGHVESAKAAGFWLLAAAGLAAAAALLALPGPREGRAWAAAAVAAVNPVATAQLFTFYVDGQLASSVTALVAFGALAAVRGGALAGAGLAAAAVLAVNAKFTALGYAPALAAAAALGALRLRGRAAAARVAAAAALGLALGVLGVGFQPYVTNLLEKGHPLHPVAGPEAVDVVAAQLPPSFVRMGRVEKLFVATFSASRRVADRPELKLPFALRGPEIPAFKSPDVRMGGFGPWFGGAVVLAAGAFALGIARGGRAGRAPLLAAAAILGSALLNPEAWWARYAPQLWLVPVCAALVSAEGRARRAAAVLSAAVLCALAVDAAMVMGGSFGRLYGAERRLRAQLGELARASGPVEVDFGAFTSGRVRFEEAGIAYREVSPLPCADPAELASGVVRFCPKPGSGTLGR